MAEVYKILGQAKPSAASSTDLYTVPADTQTVVASIIVCNQDAVDTEFRVSLAPAGAALSDEQYLHFDVAIVGNETYIATIGIGLEATDVIRVYCTLATVSFNAVGIEVSV